MTAKEIKENAKKYVLQSWSKQGALDPIPVEKAEGIYFYDYDGNRYTDMSSQLVNMNLGYGNPDIAEAIRKQVDQYCFIGPSYGSESRVTLAKMIVDLLPDTFGKVFFTNAGADANENAIKIARMYTGRKRCSAVIAAIMALLSVQEISPGNRDGIRWSREFPDL